MTRTPLAALAATVLFAVALPAPAAVVFSEDFEDDTVGSPPTDSGGTTYLIDDGGADTEIVVQDQGAIGTVGGNQYLQLLDASTTNNVVFGFGLSSTGGDEGALSVQFDFNEPTGGGAGGFNLRLGSSNDNNSAGVDLFFNNGALAANAAGTIVNLPGYSLDATDTYTLVVDDTANTYDVVRDGVLIGDDLAFRNDVSILGLFAQVTNSNQQTVFLDNILFSDTAAIPEPASATAIAALGALALRRRRNAA